MREPLLHFMLGGAALFLLFNYASDSEVDDDQIVVTSGKIEHLATLFVKTRQRAPTDMELRGLIDDYVLEEVLYREALAIGLDRDDTIVRRRLRQKIEFLLDDFTAVDPTDADLQQLLDKQPDRFRLDARITFEQVYLKNESRDVAGSILALLHADDSDPNSYSESHLIAYRFDDVSKPVVAARLGDAFTAELFALQAGQWTGPVDSPFGVHLVRVEHIVVGLVPALADIRAIAKREWLVDFRAAAQQKIIEQMKAKYTVTIDVYEAPTL